MQEQNNTTTDAAGATYNVWYFQSWADMQTTPARKNKRTTEPFIGINVVAGYAPAFGVIRRGRSYYAAVLVDCYGYSFEHGAFFTGEAHSNIAGATDAARKLYRAYQLGGFCGLGGSVKIGNDWMVHQPPQFCDLCGIKMPAALHGTRRCEYHAVNQAVA